MLLMACNLAIEQQDILLEMQICWKPNLVHWKKGSRKVTLHYTVQAAM